MTNKINLITGETYTLGELFSGTRRIIIPDLQRDYCWGNNLPDKGNVNLVEGFLETLVEQFDNHRYGRLSLGLLYGYENPENYVQLCDGQQRITTLFLLLGMLNKWMGDDRYRHYLMSDFEFYDDDHEPYLQYSIRESSLYFMSDLVYRFFTLGGEETIESVNSIYDFSTGESCSWFYGEYATDPSIMSMLRCLEIIELWKDRLLPGNDTDRLEAFVEFIVDRLTFIYYDMGSRANGEETFVIINTTGEPLSPTENLKPLVINDEKNLLPEGTLLEVNCKKLLPSQAWEEMENHFWRIRRKKDFDTADSGFNEFLRWTTLLHQYNSVDLTQFKQNAKEDFDYRFPYKDIPLTEITRVYNAFVKLKEEYSHVLTEVGSLGAGDKLEQKDLFVYLPLLARLLNNPEIESRQMIRLWRWLRNLIRNRNVGKSVNELLADVIRIGAEADDITDILTLNGISSTLLTEEERFKLEILQGGRDEEKRRDLEEDIWTAYDMEVDVEGQLLFDVGEIRPLLMWATTNCTLDSKAFEATRFKHYIGLLKERLRTGHHTVNDDTRRALVAWGYKGIPHGRSYGWKGSWKDIINHNILEFKHFLDAMERLGLNHILKFDNTDCAIVRYPGVLAYSDQKNFDTWARSGYNVCRSSYAQPIPVSLAAIMARMGVIVERNSTQRSGDWNIQMTKEGVLVITPFLPNTKRIEEMQVTSVGNGRKLQYRVKASAYEFEIALPLYSAETLIARLVNSPERTENKRLTLRRVKRGRRKNNTDRKTN